MSDSERSKQNDVYQRAALILQGAQVRHIYEEAGKSLDDIVVALSAIGLSQAEIAMLFDKGQATVSRILARSKKVS